MVNFKHRQTVVFILMLSFLFGCKTDHANKKDTEDLFWNASLKTENSFIKEAVKELNDVKGESLIVDKYNSPQTRAEVINFFTNYTGNSEISETILEYSIEYDVPPTLSFALSYAESSFNPYAINRNRTSIDRGLFQLNSNTFTDMTLEDFYDIDTNASAGIKFIRWCLDTGKNEVSALAMYNAGSGRVSGGGTPKMTLDYISKILTFRGELIDEFNSEMNLFARINPRSIKLVKDVTQPLDRR